MNIAYLTSVYARPSDTFVRSEVIELRRRGHAVHTFSIRREAQAASVSEELASEQARTDYILSHGPAPLLLAFLVLLLQRPRRMAATAALAWRTRSPGLKALLLQAVYLVEAAYLARRLQSLQVDVLHNHIAENSATVAMLASALSGVPFSMTVHGPGIFYRPLRWALPEKVQRAAFTACITEFCRSQCMVFTPTDAWDRLHVVRCAVGRSFMDVSPQPIPPAPRLVFVGRLCAEKGLPVLVEAVARLVERGVAIEVALIGDGPLRGHVERAVRERRLGAALQLLGWKGSDEVRAEIERSRALVLPSFAEGLPVVLMESLALGRPVVTTTIAGIPELVESGRNGWLVPPGAVEPLAEAMAAVAHADPQVLAEMGHDGARRVRRLHHLGTEVDKLEALLAAAAARAGTEPTIQRSSAPA
ncbi:glycosyltransferase family 4 protein [Aquabacterium sp. J223]|uniref:glycosyltransferase family 4 protein n=1 Tax=Aquabacterium sp. J223 TaxID=2898431 RepID=UPI0021AE21B2|nr:glycosyltransferase family 4 protein [Aquabacterium sp. J223]UUX96836.1 glycosyltransferase family 4 protein [Aquabacterium sp. J223]